jgi:hypothetical protein
VAPFLYEGGEIIVANWQTMGGSYREPRTPILNTIREWSGSSREAVRLSLQRNLLHGHWSPSLAMPFAVALAFGGSLMLRKTR